MQICDNNEIKLTTRGQYAIIAMIELSKAGEEKPAPLCDIAEKANISLSYLEQLIAGLRRHDLVKSSRGPGGGYTLAKQPSDIQVCDILRAAEDSTPAKRNAGNSEFKTRHSQETVNLWSHISSILEATLRHITLDDVNAGRLSDHPRTSKLFEVLA